MRFVRKQVVELPFILNLPKGNYEVRMAEGLRILRVHHELYAASSSAFEYGSPITVAPKNIVRDSFPDPSSVSLHQLRTVVERVVTSELTVLLKPTDSDLSDQISRDIIRSPDRTTATGNDLKKETADRLNHMSGKDRDVLVQKTALRLTAREVFRNQTPEHFLHILNTLVRQYMVSVEDFFAEELALHHVASTTLAGIHEVTLCDDALIESVTTVGKIPPIMRQPWFEHESSKVESLRIALKSGQPTDAIALLGIRARGLLERGAYRSAIVEAATIDSCLDLAKPQSFFLFAGAGSGKTRSLVQILEKVRVRSGADLRLHGRQIAVITYTNVARDEISRRLQFDPLVAVSTIHSFVWEQIRGFDRDIRAWLKANITLEIAELEAEQAKGKKASQAAIDRAEKIQSMSARLLILDVVRTFTYSPTGDNRTKDSLNHSEVIKISADFLQNKPLMQRLLVSRYPVLLIDESQDTNKTLIDAFFAVQTAHEASFCLGLFGDTMQRIYSDGKVDLGKFLPSSWKTPAKLVNHRCPRRVITLINKIRSEVDTHQQEPSADASEGVVRFFIANGDGADRNACEAHVRKRMAEFTGDKRWNEIQDVKALTLEHHMAAHRLGFADIFSALDPIRDFSTGLRDGTLPLIAFFTGLVLPLVSARLAGNHFLVAAIVRERSPLLSADTLAAAEVDQAVQLKMARDGVESLACLFANNGQPTIHQVLVSVAVTKLFRIPQSLLPFVGEGSIQTAVAEPEETEEEMGGTKALEAIRMFLGAPFAQMTHYANYVQGRSSLATHQGVKGLEFPRVLVVMDDSEARGFMFSFEKLFGAEAPTTTDVKNAREGKETGIDRTRRLFYVTCSRAQRSLALVAYSSARDAVKKNLIDHGWFGPEEIELL